MNMMEEGTDFGPVGSGTGPVSGQPDIPLAKPTGQIMDNGPHGHMEIRSDVFNNSGVVLNGIQPPTQPGGNFLPDDFPGRPYVSMRDAIRANDIEAIAPFLQADNFNPDERGDNNKTLLHEVALSNLQPVEMANLGQKLIQKGADPNLPDNRQDTPLHIAVKRGLHALAEVLIQGGANSTESFNSDGNLPWFYADKLEPGSRAKMEDILRVGLEMFIKSTHAGRKKKASQPPPPPPQQQQPLEPPPPPVTKHQPFYENQINPSDSQFGPIFNASPNRRQNPPVVDTGGFESLTDIIARKERENQFGGSGQDKYTFDIDGPSGGPKDDYWTPSGSYSSPFIRDEDRQGSSIWPEAPNYRDDDLLMGVHDPSIPPSLDRFPNNGIPGSGNQLDPLGQYKFPPIIPPVSRFPNSDMDNRTKFHSGNSGNSGARVSRIPNAIGAELRTRNGNSPFDDRQSEDSDSRWEPASLWKDSNPYEGSTENLWKERPTPEYDSDNSRSANGSSSRARVNSGSGGGTTSREEATKLSIPGNKVFGEALKSVRADADRQEIQRKNRTFNFGNSAMDAVTSEITSENTEEKRNKDKLRKLCEQYRGKFPRIEGIHNTKEKAVAVLHFSAEQGFNMGISDALDAGVDVNSRRNAKSALLRTIVDGRKVNLDSARLLLRHGADTDFQDANGNTFLHLAVAAAHVNAVESVLRHNPSLELKNNTGLTAWGLAQTKKGGGNVDIVRNLLVSSWKRYKNKRSEDKELERNRDEASGGKESPPLGGAPCAVRKSLISAANCGAQDQIKQLLADPSIDVNEQSAKGFSALHCAAGQGKIGIVRMLLNAGANPDLQTRDGFTPLMLTALSTRAWPEVADALLKAGGSATCNLRDMNGNTALHHAARNVHVRLVQLLCARGADVSIRNKQGIQARGVKPWDGKRGWNQTPERWSQETKDAVRDIKNALQEAFNKQRMKKEIEQREQAEQQERADRNERIKRRAKLAEEKDSKRDETPKTSKLPEEDQKVHSSPPIGGSLIPRRVTNEASVTPPSPPAVIQLSATPPPPASTPPIGKPQTDYGPQLIAVSTQVSSVSSQISHVNTTVMRLADQQSQLTNKEYQRDATVKELVEIAKQNQAQMQRIEAQLQHLTLAIQPDQLAKSLAALMHHSEQNAEK